MCITYYSLFLTFFSSFVQRMTRSSLCTSLSLQISIFLHFSFFSLSPLIFQSLSILTAHTHLARTHFLSLMHTHTSCRSSISQISQYQSEIERGKEGEEEKMTSDAPFQKLISKLRSGKKKDRKEKEEKCDDYEALDEVESSVTTTKMISDIFESHRSNLNSFEFEIFGSLNDETPDPKDMEKTEAKRGREREREKRSKGKEEEGRGRGRKREKDRRLSHTLNSSTPSLSSPTHETSSRTLFSPPLPSLSSPPLSPSPSPSLPPPPLFPKVTPSPFSSPPPYISPLSPSSAYVNDIGNSLSPPHHTHKTHTNPPSPSLTHSLPYSPPPTPPRSFIPISSSNPSPSSALAQAPSPASAPALALAPAPAPAPSLSLHTSADRIRKRSGSGVVSRHSEKKDDSPYCDTKTTLQAHSSRLGGNGTWISNDIQHREKSPKKEKDRSAPAPAPSPKLDSPKIEIGDWNGRFQAIQSKLCQLMSQSDPRVERDVLDYQEISIEMINLIHDFLSASVTYGKIIVQERYLEEKEKVCFREKEKVCE